METKPKVTKKSAPKETKSTSLVAALGKNGVEKTKKIVVPRQEQTSDGAIKSTMTVSKEKPQPLTVTPEPKQEIVANLAENAALKGKTPVIQTDPQAPSIMDKVQKWLEIKLILEKMKEDALREIRKSVKNGTEAVAAIEPGGDIYDQASSERDRELGLLLGDREREKIHSIDEALLRINEGEYGICEECDEDIPLGRLKAMPFTRHCVKCKSDLEKLQAQTKRVEEERAYREIPLGAEEDES
jgi:DnaK suppressor protein